MDRLLTARTWLQVLEQTVELGSSIRWMADDIWIDDLKPGEWVRNDRPLLALWLDETLLPLVDSLFFDVQSDDLSGHRDEFAEKEDLVGDENVLVLSDKKGDLMDDENQLAVDGKNRERKGIISRDEKEKQEKALEILLKALQQKPGFQSREWSDAWNARSLTFKEYDTQYRHSTLNHGLEAIHVKVPARVGIMGNPSDGFYGKTLSSTIQNYWVDVVLYPNNTKDTRIHLHPSGLSDPYSFQNLRACQRHCLKNGYDGAHRLFLATLTRLADHFSKLGIEMDRGFSLYYKTNIPRQVGLAGSSALVTACIKALVIHYRVSQDVFPLYEQANLALDVEKKELGISAGYQDRVVQSYGGCVFMDFDQELMTSRGYGDYKTVASELLPRMWMAYIRTPEESGKVHRTVRERFDRGDPNLVFEELVFC